MFEILTPNQVKLKLLEQEKLRKKYEFELRLRSLISSIGGICENAVTEQYAIISKDLLDTNLNEYFQDFPNKSMKELLEEKGWKLEQSKEEKDYYYLCEGE